MSDTDLTPLQPADPAQGWPRVVRRVDLGGVTLLAYYGGPGHPPTTAVGLSKAGEAAYVRDWARRSQARFAVLAKEANWEAVVRLFAQRSPARFRALAFEVLGAEARGDG